MLRLYVNCLHLYIRSSTYRTLITTILNHSCAVFTQTHVITRLDDNTSLSIHTHNALPILAGVSLRPVDRHSDIRAFLKLVFHLGYF